MVNDPATNCLEFISNSVGEMGVFWDPNYEPTNLKNHFEPNFVQKTEEEKLPYYLF